MKPLIVLLVAFALLGGGTWLLAGQPNLRWAGNGALAVMLLFTAVGHFAFTPGMTRMLPANLHAARIGLDYQTGQLTGPGPRYLWFRVPLQLLFVGWTWYFGLHLGSLSR